MNNIYRKTAPFVSLIILSSILVFIYYGKIMTNPNGYLFANSGDGIKNYYTYSYYINNDNLSTDFTGMNYPYGEHFQYTDCTPLVAFTVKLFPSLHDKSIGILNFFMIFSIILTSLFLFLIFQKLKINPLLNVLSSIGITALAPQIFRLTGHLSLSFSFFIPLFILLLISFVKAENKNIWVLLMTLNNLFWFYIHAYLGLMGVLFMFIFLGIEFLFDFKKNLKNAKKYLNIFIVVFVPIIIFRGLLFLTDTHTDRIETPLGFFHYNAELDDIFIPNHPPLRPILNTIIPVEIHQKWEALSYIGLSAIIVLLFSIWKIIKNIFKKKKITYNKIILILFITSLFLLMYAFAFPFKQMPILLDWFPVFKQFRTTGRFTWFFFFIVNIYSVYVLNVFLKHWQETKNKIIPLFIILLFPIVQIWEGRPYHVQTSESITKTVNYFDKDLLDSKYLDAFDAIEPTDYQAIIPLPFYHLGSEVFTIVSQNNIALTSMLTSYHLNMPIVGSILSRTSMTEAKKIISLLSPSFYKKGVKKDFDSDKPFLVIVTNEEINKHEKAIVDKSELLFQNEELSFYKLAFDKLFENTANHEIEKFKSLDSLLFEKNNFYVSDSNAFVYYNSFDSLQSKYIYRGNGAFECPKTGYNFLAKFDSKTFSPEKTYTASLWINNKGTAINDWLPVVIEETDSENNIISQTKYFVHFSMVINKDWSFVELDFKVADENNKISIFTQGKKRQKDILNIDDLLIREKNVDVYKVIRKKDDEIIELFKNNHQIIRE